MKLKLIKRFSYKVPKYIYLKTYNQTNLITDFNIIDDYYIFQSNYNIDVYSEYKNNNYYDIIKKFVVPHLVLIISFIAIIYCFVKTPYIIRKIDFTKDGIHDQIILEDVKNVVSEKEFLYKNINLNEMSNKLMLKYPHYSWIGVNKEGSTLLLDIRLSDISDLKFNSEKLNGDLVSKYDAYVRHIEVKQGHLIVGINQIVKKGELIVSGNLNYKKNQPNDLFVSPKAIILGEVIERYSFKIKKNNSIYSLTNNNYKKTYFSFNGKTYKKPKKHFQNSKIVEKVMFNLFGFKIIESIEYEIEEDIFEYTNESILDYVNSLIYYQLEKQRISDLEQIISINVLNFTEENDNFVVEVITREYKNIVLFQQRD